MATQQKPEATGTAVATQRAPKMLDVTSAEASAKFLDAYSKGGIDKLPPDKQTMFLFALGERLGVKAELGELMLFQGKPYITLDGRLRLAHRSGLLTGMETRPATMLEKRNFGCEDGDALWVVDVYRRGSARPFRGWGHVARKTERNPVAKQFPREMAKKRAKYDALREAFPPAEELTALHQQYIEDAERAAAAVLERSPVGRALAPVSTDPYGMDDPTDDVETLSGDEQAADAGGTVTLADVEPGELPLGTTTAAAPARPRVAQREGL